MSHDVCKKIIMADVGSEKKSCSFIFKKGSKFKGSRKRRAQSSDESKTYSYVECRRDVKNVGSFCRKPEIHEVD
jgi:hypothetical protein